MSSDLPTTQRIRSKEGTTRRTPRCCLQGGKRHPHTRYHYLSAKENQPFARCNSTTILLQPTNADPLTPTRQPHRLNVGTICVCNLAANKFNGKVISRCHQM